MSEIMLQAMEKLQRERDEARTQEKWHFDNYVYTQELYNELREQMDALAKALEIVRDADNDCHSDGLQTIPPAVRHEIDLALAAVKGKNA
jgi:hypothetical protein